MTIPEEDFNRMMDEYTNGMREYHQEIERKNNPILEAIKEEKGQDWYNELCQLIEESQVSGLFEIMKIPYGEKQPSSDLIEWEWVDQRSVGDSGDSFEGHIIVQIGENRYLKMPFSM